ncbi:MAG: hypothetical protein ACPKPY_00515 [Nitrososphaeraceae archaeon]
MTKDPNNFRLDIISDIQRVISYQTTSFAFDEYGTELGIDFIVKNHMGQAFSWTKLFGSRYRKSEQGKEDSEKESHRPIKF